MSTSSEQLDQAAELEEQGKYEEAAQIYEDLGLDNLADAARELAEE